MSREIDHQTNTAIESEQDLLETFVKGGRQPDSFVLGVETELLGLDTLTHKNPVFLGGRGLEQILKNMATRTGWKTVHDRTHIIALKKGEMAITLEPGGQLELSGAPHRAIAEIEQELREHLHELKVISDPFKIVWLAKGIHPTVKLEEVHWIPRERYEVMRCYYKKRSRAAWEMMALTAAIQINLDYMDEIDARAKVMVGAKLSPVVGALYANSAVERNMLNGFCSRRLSIWSQTDVDRCGVPRFFVDGSFTYEKYRDYALDIPIYFLRRGGHYVPQEHLTFRQRMHAEQEDRLTQEDWLLHLSTLFPDVRLTNHLEMRSADSGNVASILSLAAFWKGLLYNQEILESASKRLSVFDHEDISKAFSNVSVLGLRASIGRESVLNVARDMLDLAAMGLTAQDKQSGLNEIRYLAFLRERVEKGLSPAQEIRNTWQT